MITQLPRQVYRHESRPESIDAKTKYLTYAITYILIEDSRNRGYGGIQLGALDNSPGNPTGSSNFPSMIHHRSGAREGSDLTRRGDARHLPNDQTDN